MAATLNGMYSSAPDTPSPVYPDRLIRPLPKRPLRTRLSSDAADSILYPPAPPATQLFYGACADNGEMVNDAKVYVQECESHHHSPEGEHLPYENGVEAESGDEDGPVVVHRSAGFRGSPLSPSAVNAQPQPHPGNGEGTPIKSSSAGPDGYDAFENSNNKKKRKIPTPGNLGNHSTLSPEFSTMGLTPSAQSTGPPGDGSHVSTFYGTGSPASPVGHGMSGPGRGRLGRHAHRNSTGRGSVSHPSPVTWSQGRTRRDGLSSPGSTGEYTSSDQGIISAAIANAAASAFPSPPRGSKAVSMLEQQATTPTKTQFTFTCESDSSKGMALQPQSPYAATHRSPGSVAAGQNQRRFSTQATQTSPNTASQMSQQPGHPPSAAAVEPNSAGRKKKRSPGSIYALAARQRKIQQQYTNLHHPPNLEDIWICEFCEYESIFGRPPEALIRQYEIKDRKERKRLAEKKRLLEKAKMKGRKNKKTPKGATKHTASHQGCCDGSHDRASADHSSLGGGPGQHDDDYDYDDEPVGGPPPAAPPSGTFKTPLPPGNHPKAPASASGVKGAADGGTNRPP